MKNPGFEFRMIKFILVCLLLVGCSPGTQAHSPTPSPTLDPCTEWWCTATGIVYAGAVEPGNELEGAIITLNQSSFCSPTSGQQETISGSDGKFEFSELFFHDTDGIRVEVAYEGSEMTQWDTKPLGCLHCDCFVIPLEILLQAAHDQ
jgi:hypothetical protein